MVFLQEEGFFLFCLFFPLAFLFKEVPTYTVPKIHKNHGSMSLIKCCLPQSAGSLEGMASQAGMSFPRRGDWVEHHLWNTGKGVPVLADIQKQGGHCSGQPALPDDVQEEGLD